MLRFEYEEINEGIKNKTIIEDSEEGNIHDLMEVFVRFLRGISYSNCVIISGLEGAIDKIKDDIKEEYIMTEDNPQDE